MIKYKVSIRYDDFIFTDADEAMAFANTAILHREEEDVAVEINLFIEKEKTESEGN